MALLDFIGIYLSKMVIEWDFTNENGVWLDLSSGSRGLLEIYTASLCPPGAFKDKAADST